MSEARGLSNYREERGENGQKMKKKGKENTN